MTNGRHPSQTATTIQNLSHVAIFLTECMIRCRISTGRGSDCGIFGEYSFVNLKGVLQSSQCFFCECDSHSIKQSWWTNLILPLHLQGWNSGSVSLPSDRHILHVSASPDPSSPSSKLVVYWGSFMTSGSGAWPSWISAMVADDHDQRRSNTPEK